MSSNDSQRKGMVEKPSFVRCKSEPGVSCTGSLLKKAAQRHSERSEESLFEQKSKGKEGFLTPRTPPACRGLVRDDAQFFANLLVS